MHTNYSSHGYGVVSDQYILFALSSGPSSALEQAVERPARRVVHSLAIEIEGFMCHSLDKREQLRHDLQEVVRTTSEFQRAQARQELLCRSGGDGLALIFLTDPLSPAQCALEILHEKAWFHELSLRMGIHTGVVTLMPDLNGREDVVGPGVDMAQRVMESAYAGQVLISESNAIFLREMEGWSQRLQPCQPLSLLHETLALWELDPEIVPNTAA